MLNILNIAVFGILIFIIYNFLLFHYSSSLVKGKKEYMQNYSSFENKSAPGWGLAQDNLDLDGFLKKLEFHSANKRSSLLNTVSPIEKTIHSRNISNNLVMSTNPLDASDYSYYTEDKERNIINNSHHKSEENNETNKRPSPTQNNLPAPHHYNSNGFINLLSSMFFPSHHRPHHHSHHRHHNHRHYHHHNNHHKHYPSNFPHHTRGQEYHHHKIF